LNPTPVVVSGQSKELEQGTTLMNILFRVRGLAPSPELLVHVHRRLVFALARFAPRIRAVRVLLADENGPRGGTDKRVRVDILLARRGRILVEDLSDDLFTAADRAAQRGSRALARALDRKRMRSRNAGLDWRGDGLPA
jgi:putative sigma-54 modulation protein